MYIKSRNCIYVRPLEVVIYLSHGDVYSSHDGVYETILKCIYILNLCKLLFIYDILFNDEHYSYKCWHS